MKVLKLVLGIICICLAGFIIFQSCAAGVVDAIENKGGISGASGMFVSLLMIAGGIVMIATRKAEKAGGSIAGIVIFLVAAIIGFAGAGIFEDLKVWAVICFIIAVVNAIAAFTVKKKDIV